MSGFRLAAIGTATAIAITIASCSLTHAPSPSETFDVNWKTQQPTRTSPEAELYLTNSGLWGYEPHERDRLDDELTPGDLFYFSSGDAGHVFALAEVTRRGYLLQRLDDRPVAGDLVGHFRPLTADTVDENQRLCIATDEAELYTECEITPRHRRWNLYELNQPPADTALNVAGDYDSPRRAFGLPVSRRAIAGGDILDSWVETDDDALFASPVLAIRSEPRVAATLRPTVVYEPDCLPTSPASSLVDANTVEAIDSDFDADQQTSIVAVEDAAIRTGADTIATCVEGDPLLMIPVLSRPLLQDDRGQFIAPAPFGMKPRHLEDTAPSEQKAWARAAALVAVGDTSAASFWIERALDERPDSDFVEEFALSATSVLAGAGHPELAINVGTRLTDSAWDPRNIPDHLDGLIVLLGVLDQRQDQRELIEQRDNLARRHYDDSRVAWHIWTELRLMLANRRSTYGPAYNDVVDELQAEELDEWALAIWATLAMYGETLPIVDEPEVLDPLFSDAGADTLWARVRGAAAPAECTGTDGCIPTSYGWRPSGGGTDASGTLRTIAPNELIRGYDRDGLKSHVRTLDEHRHRLAIWLDAAPLVPDADLPAVTAAVMRSLDEQFATDRTRLCGELEVWEAHFAGAGARHRLRSADGVHRRTSHYFDWWSATGLEALCAGTEEFLDALEAHGDAFGEWSHLLMPLIERQIVGLDDTDAVLAAYRRTAELADELGDGDACASWNLAIVVASTRAGRFDDAESHLVDASRCVDSDSDLAGPFHVVSAYLDFERGAGHSVLTDGSTQRAIDRATSRRIDDPDTCVGLLPLDFRLDSQLPNSLVRIVDQLDLEPAPYDDFGRLTATNVINRGRSAYLSGLRDLRRGQLLTAALAINEAQKTFSRLEHLPGLARIEFIDQTIYGGRLHELVDEANDDDGDPEPLVSELESKAEAAGVTTEHLVDDPADTPTEGGDEPWIAASLIAGHEAALKDYAEYSSTSLPPSLCDPEQARRVIYTAAERALDDDFDDPETDDDE